MFAVIAFVALIVITAGLPLGHWMYPPWRNPMKRVTHMLAALYTGAAVVLLRCAYTSQEHGSTLYAAFFAGAAILFAVAIGHHAYHRDELRAALVRLERASRPLTPATDAVVAVALAAACCEPWWASAGAEHDPATCTRRDSTA